MRGGKPGSQGVGRTGKSTLLAKADLDTHGQMEDDPAAENIQQNHQNGGQSRERSWSIKTDRNWGCIVAAVVVVLVPGIVLWLVGSIFRFWSPILVPVLTALTDHFESKEKITTEKRRLEPSHAFWNLMLKRGSNHLK